MASMARLFDVSLSHFARRSEIEETLSRSALFGQSSWMRRVDKILSSLKLEQFEFEACDSGSFFRRISFSLR